jgi:uncharacterized iron-regulated protein
MPHAIRCWTVLAVAALLAACAAPGPRIDSLTGADVVLLGERHDDPVHQRHHRDVVQTLAARGRLAAVALEMAEQGTSTAGLPRQADESAARAALQWNEEAWPWAAYGPAVMAAVGAGVPVLGANLPRSQMRAAMQDGRLDGTLDAQALAAQREAVRAGHCDLLPERQLEPMVRVQVARDRAMAQTVERALVPGRTVVLIAGAGHVAPALGVPRHLPANLDVRPVLLDGSGQAPARDYCEELRRQLKRP